MIALVVVSHSRALAGAAVGLALQMAQDGNRPPLEVAAGIGTGEPGDTAETEVLGTDASAVAGAMTRAVEASEGAGALVLVDLGSALLSAEMALELVAPDVAAQVRISPAPLVEGLVAAVVAAAAGGDLDAVAAEARAGLQPKLTHLAPSLLAAAPAGPAPATSLTGSGTRTPPSTDRPVPAPSGGGPAPPDGGPGLPPGVHPAADHQDAGPHRIPPPGRRDEDDGQGASGPGRTRSVELAVGGEHGLHARPAARVVACAARVAPATQVRLTNLTSGRGPVDALSLSGVATLDARRGHVLLAEARGPLAEEVLVELVDLAGRDFGDIAPPAQPLAPVEGLDPATSEEPGVAGSGLEAAMGEVVRAEVDLDVSGVEADDEHVEQARWQDAVDTAVARLAELAERARRHLGDGQAEVFEAHALLLQDPALHARVAERVRGGAPAATAWADTVSEAAARFSDLADSYQRERSQDVRSIGERVLRLLLGREEPEHLRSGILVVDELDPALAISLDARVVSGVITRRGGATGHGVLIASSRGVPVLTGVGAAVDVPEGTTVAFDARSGELVVDPSPEEEDGFARLLEQRRTERARALEQARLPVLTRDRHRLTVSANVASVAEARLAASVGAQGCGLVRTEALFGQWRTAPTVRQQVEVYTAIAEAAAPHTVTIRTWDVGGDKPLLFVPTDEEANPFLGARGVRAFEARPEILLDQLEAVCRVADRHPVQLMFPMITTAADVTRALELLETAAGRAGLPGRPDGLGVGIMVEVPAAAIQTDVLAAGLDFVSIGTNDLSQYTLASERGNAKLARWSDHLEPAVLRLIRWVCDSVPDGLPVSVCGTMASEPALAGLIAGLGVTELSASAATVPLVKERLRGATMSELRALADRAVRARDAEEVRELLG